MIDRNTAERLDGEATGHDLGGTARSPLDDAAERRLDALVRPILLVEPPAEFRTSLLASVLRAADALDAERPALHVSAIPSVATSPDLSAWAYPAVAALIATYLAVIGSLGGAAVRWDWLPVLIEQLQAAASIVGGGAPGGLIIVVLQGLAEQAPWVALLPLLWLLWERDRALPLRQ